MAYTKLETTKDGRQYYRIFVSQGRGKSKLSTRWYIPDGMSLETKKGAERVQKALNKAIADFENKVDAGEIKTRADIKAERVALDLEKKKIKTLRQYGEEIYMPTKASTKEEKTRAYYQFFLDHYIYDTFGDMPLPTIEASQINAFLLRVVQSNVSQSTINGVYITLSQLLKMARIDNAIDSNPMENIKKPKVSKGVIKNKEKEHLTEEELNQVLACADKEGLRWKTFIYMLAFSGCRVGEICGLRWKDVDLDHKTITISNNACFTEDKGIYCTTPKGKKSRCIPITNDKIVDFLKELKMSQAKEVFTQYCFPLCIGTRYENGVQISIYENAPLNPKTPYRYLRKFSKKYGLENLHLHPHLFRHTLATIMVKNHVDIITTSQILGHAKPSTTSDMYAHSSDAQKVEALNVFSEALKENQA